MFFKNSLRRVLKMEKDLYLNAMKQLRTLVIKVLPVLLICKLVLIYLDYTVPDCESTLIVRSTLLALLIFYIIIEIVKHWSQNVIPFIGVFIRDKLK